MDRLTSLEVFVRVADLGSFTQAAEQLTMSRAMVSKHVQALEDRLGTLLITRTTRRLSLTEAGQSFYSRCRQVLAELEEAEAEASDAAIAPKGVLKVNAPMSFGIHHVAPALAAFAQSYPGVRVALTLNDRFVDLIEEGFDVAIRIGTLADSSLIARTLAPCRMILCAAPSYLERRGIPRHPDDLADHDCLAYTLSAHPAEWPFAGPGGEQRVVRLGASPLSANNGEALALAAAAGLGIVLSPSFMAAPFLRDGRLVAIPWDWRRADLGIHAVYPSGRHVPAKVRRFIDFLNQRFGPAPYWDADLP